MKNKIKTLDLLFLVLIITIIRGNLFAFINSSDYQELKIIRDTGRKTGVSTIIIMKNLIRIVFILTYIFAIYIGIRIALKKHYKEKMDTIDYKNDTYYRDTIEKYSPAVLSYVDDYNLSNEDMVATILSLKLKGKIDIDKEINIKNVLEDNLENNEKYILNLIKENKLKDFKLKEFQEIVIEDSLTNKLIEKEENQHKKMIKIILKSTLILPVSLLVIILLMRLTLLININRIDLLLGIIILFSFIFPVVLRTYIRTYRTYNKIDPYVRTKEGKNVNEKLEGLRKYIEQYSLLENKDITDIELWEEYLIYSIIFGKNENAINNFKNKYNL